MREEWEWEYGEERWRAQNCWNPLNASPVFHVVVADYSLAASQPTSFRTPPLLVVLWCGGCWYLCVARVALQLQSQSLSLSSLCERRSANTLMWLCVPSRAECEYESAQRSFTFPEAPSSSQSTPSSPLLTLSSPQLTFPAFSLLPLRSHIPLRSVFYVYVVITITLHTK